MTDLLGIYNGARMHLGLDEIDDPDATDSATKSLRARYDAARDFVLRDHPWNCAEVRGYFEVDTDPDPVFGFTNAYKLPNDPYCLRVHAVIGATAKEWKVSGRTLLCNIAAPLPVVFTRRLEDPTLIDAMTAEAISLWLAFLCAPKIANRANRRKSLKDDYADVVSQAKGADGQEGTPPAYFTDTFLTSRY